MNIGPDQLPEMRNCAIDNDVIDRVDDMLMKIKKIMGSPTNTANTHHNLKYVGTALIFTCNLEVRLTLAEQWLLRQRLLEFEWDEVEFELQLDDTHSIAMIEHYYPKPPRTLHGRIT